MNIITLNHEKLYYCYSNNTDCFLQNTNTKKIKLQKRFFNRSFEMKIRNKPFDLAHFLTNFLFLVNREYVRHFSCVEQVVYIFQESFNFYLEKEKEFTYRFLT